MTVANDHYHKLNVSFQYQLVMHFREICFRGKDLKEGVHIFTALHRFREGFSGKEPTDSEVESKAMPVFFIVYIRVPAVNTY